MASGYLIPDNHHWQTGVNLNFLDEGKVSVGSKTQRFSVHSRHTNVLLGYVKWYVQWRQYVFFPLNAIFDKKCLREIADFCERMTVAERAR